MAENNKVLDGGDETLRLKLINHLGLNAAQSPVGAAPDLAAFVPRRADYPDGVVLLEDWCLGEHTNGVHSARTTNLHTHGLHVRPGVNPDGTHSDNIFLRVMPRADYQRRQAHDGCRFLRDLEQVGQADYEFHLGRVMGDPEAPHPPGTHWYHPHPHAGRPDPDPAIKTGPYDYRERLMMIQRVNPSLVSADPDAQVRQLQAPPVPATNGTPEPMVITMRPGAVERWRVLNGSVDGKGYLHFMVLKGRWVHEVPPSCPGKDRAKNLKEVLGCLPQLLRVDAAGVRHIPTTEEIEAAKVPLYQLAMDGVTLVHDPGDGPRYFVKDLDFDAPPNPLRQDFTNLAACYRDATTLHGCYDRPNELYMAPANRADFFFQAPRLRQRSSWARA